ncbi:hypothetical protein F5Y05DRAFT_420029 [Hypoxylon sp. FL0543]|nr:hypothetical protein F5Y05DRAFT_420029 [Hypoxylon sp. FL0543]
MSQPPLTPEQEAHLNDTRQPALWGCLITFLVISDAAIAGRLWGTWKSMTSRSPFMAENISLVLSGVSLDSLPRGVYVERPSSAKIQTQILVNAIIANLMVATHYGLGLHTYTVNARDPNYPTNLSKTFRHIWITMVLMSAFFACIKMTLLFFYRRLFLVANSRLRIFWWANLVYIVLWFFGGTAFYLFQCKPVEWYYIQYYARFPHIPVPGGMKGQCNATSVLHVSLPVIFSLISDIGLLLLPIVAISKLRLGKSKKRGLLAVFGIGLIAALLELARVLDLLIDTDDKTDPSYGVAIFLILTAAEETTAVVCASVPVILPQLAKKLRKKRGNGSYPYDRNDGRDSSGKRSSRGFKRVASLNHLWTTPTGLEISQVDATHEDDVPLTSVEVTGKSTSNRIDPYSISDSMQPQHRDRVGDVENQVKGSYVLPHAQGVNPTGPSLGIPSDIFVHTDIQVQVGDVNK